MEFQEAQAKDEALAQLAEQAEVGDLLVVRVIGRLQRGKRKRSAIQRVTHNVIKVIAPAQWEHGPHDNTY